MSVSLPAAVPRKTFADVRAALLERREIALLDVREEDPHARAHPLFAANLPLSRLELEVYARLPRRDAAIVTLDDGEGYAERAARRLSALGYNDVAVLAGGVSGWQAAGGELFCDVNVPSKAFGELVDATRNTPALEAEAVKKLLDAQADMVVLDVRRFDEYQTMSIPTAINVPGAELALRASTLAPRHETMIIVNCAGRTRGIIGAQSLVNAGLPNPVFALKNGTIGWTLAGQALEHGQTRRFGPVAESARRQAAARAKRLAERAGVQWTSLAEIEAWKSQDGRTTFFFDVRDPEEYAAGHLPGFRSVPGGQLAQETEMIAPTRGARMVLFDDDGARANMTASWLAQMDWEVYTLTLADTAALTEHGHWQAPLPPTPDTPRVHPVTLADWLDSADPPAVIDLTAYANYRRGHIPGAWFALRAGLAEALEKIPRASRHVLTCASSQLARFAFAELAAMTSGEVFVLEGGSNAWKAANLPLEQTERLASEPLDRYRRPYEGTDNSAAAMQAYLDWESGLVAQLERDGTHHFRVIQASAGGKR
ncbi:MAG: rhodanese homology domain-containing protein [Zoogloeaceae bacterium]|jgi:rhodanese-related sulfurtransferase|nr:rhodanese homology domain-containing protein [Zoogloeaceae bacterium]